MPVVNIKKAEYDVYIGRGSPWGNPYRIGVHGSRAEVIAMYEEYIRNNPKLLARLHELKGKIMGCHCKPKQCHGDVLEKLLTEI